MKLRTATVQYGVTKFNIKQKLPFAESENKSGVDVRCQNALEGS